MTLKQRCAKYPALAGLLRLHASGPMTLHAPTDAEIAVQQAHEAAFRAQFGDGIDETRCFPCLCPDSYLHPYGTTCAVCGMNGFNALRFTAKWFTGKEETFENFRAQATAERKFANALRTVIHTAGVRIVDPYTDDEAAIHATLATAGIEHSPLGAIRKESTEQQAAPKDKTKLHLVA